MGNLFITYNSVGLNKVSHFSRRDRAPSRLPIKKLKSLLQKTRKVRLFVWKGIRKNTTLSSEIHCYVKDRKGCCNKLLVLFFVIVEQLILLCK